MTTYKSRADLLIAAGESIKMQEAAGIEPICKVGYHICKISRYAFTDENMDVYQFPIAVIEGKAVFVGDELYDVWGNTCKANHIADSCYGVPSIWSKDRGCFAHLNECTWVAPKPKTLMVELSLADVNFWASFGVLLTAQNQNTRFFDACRRALEQSK